MQKEMNRAGDAGYRFVAVMGGATSFGGSEVVVIMGRPAGSKDTSPYEYKLLATSKTLTMQKEMDEAVEAGFEYRMQTVSKTSFGGQEVVVILERVSEREEATRGQYEYNPHFQFEIVEATLD